MRLALAQINTTVGDLDGNRDRIVARIAEARAAGAELVVFPGARGHRLSAGGPAAPPRVRPGRRQHDRRGRECCDGDHGARRRAARRERPALQRVLRLRQRRGAGRVPQAAAAELRRLRRGAVLRVRNRGRPPRARRARDRSHGVRGPVAAGAARGRERRRGRRSPRQPLRVALSCRKGRASASRCSPRGLGTTVARSSSATPSAARTSSSSTAIHSCSIGRAASSRGRRASRRRCS